MFKILAIGLPQAMGMILISVSVLFFNRLVVGIDPLALTAFSLFGRLEQLVLMPGFALGAGVITMVGQNAGRGNFDRVRLILLTSWLIGIGITIVLALTMIGAASRIYPGLSEIQRVVDYAVHQTYTMELFYIFATVGIINRNFFQGIGYPVPAFILSLLRTILLSLPIAYLLIKVFGMEISGVWWGLNTASVLSASVSTIWVFYFIRGLKKGRIKIHRV